MEKLQNNKNKINKCKFFTYIINKLKFKKMYEFTYYEVPKVKTCDSTEYRNFHKTYREISKKFGMTTQEYIKQNNIVFTGEKLKYPGHEFRQGKKYIVYALTKPGTNLLYIGMTSHSLEWRYSLHLKRNLIEDFDTSWDMNFIMLSDNIDDEKYIIYHYLNNPNYNVINKVIYESTNDPDFDEKFKQKMVEYRKQPETIEKSKIYNSQPIRKKQRNDYQKNSDHAKEYRTDYYKYYNKAKLEGLTVKEYKTKYNYE